MADDAPMLGQTQYPGFFRRSLQAAKRAARWRLRFVQKDYERAHGGESYAYQSVIRNQAYAPWLTDAVFRELYEAVRQNTLVDVDRCYELWDLAHNLRSVPGCIIEVGVWRGGTGTILATALQRTKPNETIYLCDTFSGVVKAGLQDAVYRGGEHANTSRELVADLLRKRNITNAQLLQGIFPDETGARVVARSIALCHVDVDVFESAKDIVEWTVPRLSAGGALVFDDYGFATCVGITRLVNDLKSTGDWTAIYNLNGHAILIKR